MTLYRKVDKDGYFLEDVFIENDKDIPVTGDYEYLDVVPPNGQFKPKWNGENWVDGESEESKLERDQARAERRKANDLLLMRYTEAEMWQGQIDRLGGFDALKPAVKTAIIKSLLRMLAETTDEHIDYDLIG